MFTGASQASKLHINLPSPHVSSLTLQCTSVVWALTLFEESFVQVSMVATFFMRSIKRTFWANSSKALINHTTPTEISLCAGAGRENYALSTSRMGSLSSWLCFFEGLTFALVALWKYDKWRNDLLKVVEEFAVNKWLLVGLCTYLLVRYLPLCLRIVCRNIIYFDCFRKDT